MPLVTYLEERANRVWLGIVGLVFVVVAILAAINDGLPVFPLVYSPLQGIAFIAAGLLLWGRNRISILLFLVGVTFLLGGLQGLHVPVIVALSSWFAELWRVVLAQTALSHPEGQLRTGFPRALVVAGYVFVLGAGLIRTMAYRPYDYFNCECPRNALGFINNQRFFDAVDQIYRLAGGFFELVLIVVLLRLYAQARAGDRPLHRPLLVTAGAFALVLAVELFTDFVEVRPLVFDWLFFVVHLGFAAAAASYVLALRRERSPVGAPAGSAATQPVS